MKYDQVGRRETNKFAAQRILYLIDIRKHALVCNFDFL